MTLEEIILTIFLNITSSIIYRLIVISKQRFNKRIKKQIRTNILIFTNSTSPSAYIRANIGYLLGDFAVYSVKTYRYIYPFCKHFRFNKPELAYPEYEKSMTLITWDRDRRSLKRRVIGMINDLPDVVQGRDE